MPEKLLQYEVIERLGEGAGSVIYSVRDPASHRVFALKHVPRINVKDIRFVEQMKAEFEISRLFSHPNLRKIYDLKIVKSILLKVSEGFLLMELIEGKTLDQRPPTSVVDVLDAFIQAGEGLQAMHRVGYVHCDIKPNNIIRGEGGLVKVIDFGQTCKIGTVKQRIQGTPDFIAPEQVNRRPVVPQTDIYNLGATLYFSLTGKSIPTLYTVSGKGENSFLLDTTIATPMQLNPLVPATLSNLVMECITTRIDKRPADMEAVLRRLELAKHILTRKSTQPVQKAHDEPAAHDEPLG